MNVALVASVVAAVMAGCLGDATTPSWAGADARVEGRVGGALRVNGTAGSCTENIALRLMDFDQAGRFLPPGFEPEDAAVVLGRGTRLGGSPVAIGQGLGGIAVVTCGHVEFDQEEAGPMMLAPSVVAVKPIAPDGTTLDPDASYQELYVLQWFAGARGGLPALLASVGANMTLVAASNMHVPRGAPSLAASAVTDDDGALGSFHVASPAGRERQINVRLWHQTPHGLPVLEVRRDPTFAITGEIVSCDVGGGSLYAEAFGTTDCSGAAGVGVVFPQAWTSAGTFNFLPGATP